jgi:hypothetical protein
MQRPIVLLGPERAGKSTVGPLLAETLGLPLIHLWSICPPYWQEIGFDAALQQQAAAQGGMEGVYRCMLPFDAHAVQRALVEHPACVLELGAPQSVYDDPAILAQVRQALQPYENIVLLLPSPDVEASFRILEERRPAASENEFNNRVLAHYAQGELARHTIYTEGKTPEETGAEIFARLDPTAAAVILIGPMGCGKSTVGRLLAERGGRPPASMDERRWEYFTAAGWDAAEQQRRFEQEGYRAAHRYWAPFMLQGARRLLAEHPAHVIEFGGFDSFFEEDADAAQLRALFAPHPNIVLLLPSPDPDVSRRVLAEVLRRRHTPRINGIEANRFFLTHPSHHALAKYVVYTNGQSPEETRDEILRLVM